MDTSFEFLKNSFLGVPLEQYGIAVLCIAGGFVLRWISLAVFKWLLKHSTKTDTMADDILIEALTRPLGTFCIVLGIWAGAELLPLPTEPVNVARFVHAMLKGATEIIVIWFALRLNNRVAAHTAEKAAATGSPLADFVPLARKTIMVFLVAIGGLVFVQEMGYSVTSLIAGLGLGGLAIGLAAKDTIANFFGSLVIFVDRPFAKGDWIKIGEQEGIVEDISVRVTRIRTFEDSLITFPNAQLTTTAIANWSRMRKRRIKFTVGLTYDSPADKIELAVKEIRAFIAVNPRLHHDGFSVGLRALGTYSMDIEVSCYSITTVFAEFVDLRQELLLATLKILAKHDLKLAFPTQTILPEERIRTV